MDFQAGSLLEEISNVDKECGQILEDAEIVEDDDLKSLCYESLKDIFPGGGKKIVQRSKVWKIIQKSLKTDGSTSSVSSPSACSSVDSTNDQSDSFLCCDNDIVEVSTPKPSKSVKVKHPEYTVYVDPEISAAAKSGTMSKELKCRLVRATMHNMISAAAVPPFSRYPLTMEIEEMAKSLIIAYPCLRDPETGHGDLCSKLKKKLSNLKPIKKPQGKCPNKRRKIDQTVDTSAPKITSYLKEKEVGEGTSSATESGYYVSDEDTDNSNVIDNHEVQKRHYQLLQREMNKKKPDEKVVNIYLNKEFHMRRDWLQKIPADKRCQMVLHSYPCFSDHVEVIEEVRRILKHQPTERSNYTKDCVKRLSDEVDLMVFYGCSKGINPPRSPKLNSKITHVITKLSNIFPRPKPLKKAPELVHELQDHEDPDSFCSKQVGNLPVLLFADESVYIIVGKMILLQVNLACVAEAVVAFLATFYLLDFDYPKQHEYGLLMLQSTIFMDERVPSDIQNSFEAVTKGYKKYKVECSK